MHLRRLILSLVLMGCRSSSEPSPPSPPSVVLHQSGSRLRAKVHSAGDVKALAGWHDSMLDVDCVFATDPAGTHCLPVGGATVYADDTCKTPVTWATHCDSTPRFALELNVAGADTCSAAPRYLAVRRVRAQIAAPAKVYAIGANGCVRTSVVSNLDYYSVGDPIDFTTLVSATYSIEPRGGGVSANVLRASDGAWANDGAIEDATGIRCHPIREGDDRYACPHEPIALLDRSFGLFSDADCKKPAAQSGCGGAPSLVRESVTDDGCAYHDVYSMPGASLSAGYSNAGGSCETSQSTATSSVIQVLGAADLSRLPQLHAVAYGTGPLELSVIEAPQGPVDDASASWVHDTLGPVTLTRSSNGVWHAVPNDVINIAVDDPAFYSDAACTKRVVPFSAGCAVPPFVVQGTPSDACISGYTKVWKTGARLSTRAIYSLDSGACAPTISDKPVVELGEDVTDTLPTVDEVVE